MSIGAKIRAARIAKNMTQEELGEILGVQRSAVAKYENGRVVNIKRSILQKISDVLDIPPFELIYNEEAESNRKNATNDDSGVSDAKTQIIGLVENCTEGEAERVLQVLKLVLNKK